MKKTYSVVDTPVNNNYIEVHELYHGNIMAIMISIKLGFIKTINFEETKFARRHENVDGVARWYGFG